MSVIGRTTSLPHSQFSSFLQTFIPTNPLKLLCQVTDIHGDINSQFSVFILLCAKGTFGTTDHSLPLETFMSLGFQDNTLHRFPSVTAISHSVKLLLLSS